MTNTNDETPTQLDLPLVEKDNTVNFMSRKNKINLKTAESTATYMAEGLKAFQSELADNAKGFLAIVFDTDNNPRIIWAGDADTIQWIGALEIAKNEFFKTINSISEHPDIDFTGQDE